MSRFLSLPMVVLLGLPTMLNGQERASRGQKGLEVGGGALPRASVRHCLRRSNDSRVEEDARYRCPGLVRARQLARPMGPILTAWSGGPVPSPMSLCSVS
jgi:hypothetical protein